MRGVGMETSKLAAVFLYGIATWHGLSISLLTILLVLAFVACAALLVNRVIAAYDEYMRRDFESVYHIMPDRKTRIRKRKDAGSNTFSLVFPRWEHSNKDGSADKRRSSNRLLFGLCRLNVDCYTVRIVEPVSMMWLVNALRSSGVLIGASREEVVKRHVAEKKHRAFWGEQNVLSIVGRFADTPTNFEHYCADLYRMEGFQAEVTRPTADGGYDIMLTDQSGLTYLVECKCYSPDHKIGREYIQKLVGANAVVGASGLIFITTSDFTEEAIVYAREVGNVQLINGKYLVEMVNRHTMPSSSSLEIPEDEWRLAWSDLSAHYPPDYQPYSVKFQPFV